MRRKTLSNRPIDEAGTGGHKRLPSPFYAARKRFGQHFLEPAWVDKLIREISPGADDLFLEIGPGGGALTRPLAERARRLVAFEIDHDLSAALRATAPPHLTVVDGDFLDVTADHLHRLFTGEEWSQPIRVAGNLPYNISSPILFKLAHLFAAGVPLLDAHVMLQREVADRLVARPGTREYGVLTVLLGHTSEVRTLLSLPPGAFRPAPKVDSTVVQLRFHPPAPPVKSGQVFTELVRAVFTRRRKTLANALLGYEKRGRESFSTALGRNEKRGRESFSTNLGRHGKQGRESFSAALGRAGIDGTRRPETLTIAEFVRLADALADPALPAQP